MKPMPNYTLDDGGKFFGSRPVNTAEPKHTPGVQLSVHGESRIVLYDGEWLVNQRNEVNQSALQKLQTSLREMIAARAAIRQATVGTTI